MWLRRSKYQEVKEVELIVLDNTTNPRKICFVSNDDGINVGEFFLNIQNNKILKCYKLSCNGIFEEETQEFIHYEFCRKLIAAYSQVGWMWDNTPDDIDNTYLTHFLTKEDDSMIDYVLEENSGKCKLEVNEICPNYNGSHIGKDCSCKTGFITVPKLIEGKVIIIP